MMIVDGFNDLSKEIRHLRRLFGRPLSLHEVTIGLTDDIADLESIGSHYSYGETYVLWGCILDKDGKEIGIIPHFIEKNSLLKERWRLYTITPEIMRSMIHREVMDRCRHIALISKPVSSRAWDTVCVFTMPKSVHIYEVLIEHTNFVFETAHATICDATGELLGY